MKQTIGRVVGGVLLAMLSLPVWCATAWEENRLIPLEKLTVGPWDNFEVSVARDDQLIYFTRDQNQIPQILVQDLEHTTAQPLKGLQGDAKEPALSPDERYLAITYYGDDAQGDVCLYKLPRGPVHCLTDANTVDKTPFWVDAEHLGFLQRKTGDTLWALVVENVQTKERTQIHKGLISTPWATPGGEYVLISETQADGSVQLEAWNRQTRKLQRPPEFDLPGITGSAVTSRNGEFLYFNQYLNDTNGDQLIDGNDNSVTFRIPFRQWLQARTPQLPEQLSSVAHNCRYPAPTRQFLYLTCAFEGSLDIYRLPLTGSVPAPWGQAQLWEAHRTARSYEDRLLILNTLRYRATSHGTQMLERLLSNHVALDELTAAVFYVRQLQSRYEQAGERAAAQFYQALATLFQVRSSKRRVPVGVVTNRFQRIVAQAREEMHSQAYDPALSHLMDAWFDFELERPRQALNRLKTIALASPDLLPLQRMLTFELYRRLLQSKNPAQLLRIYPVMYQANNLPLDARIYYAFHYLKLLARVRPEPSDRIAEIQARLEILQSPQLIALFKSEIAALELILAQEQKGRNAAFAALGQLLKQNRSDVLLRKAMHVRAIQNLGAAEAFQYMELLSRNWLLTTQISEMEFVNVAEQFAIITMDKAYGMLAQGKAGKAYSTFYSAIRQTNDLEAHYQFITLGLTPELQKRENLERSYQVLQEQGLVADNMPYVEALRLLLTVPTDKQAAYRKAQKTALKKLQSMRAHGLSPAMRDLLMGAILHQQLRSSRSGYRYDKKLFQKAHYHYIMALDLGRDNSRITASVWENLAWLHFEVRNYALAVDFFTRRLQLPFVDALSEALTREAFARALYANNQPQAALEQARVALEKAQASSQLDPLPFQEKRAFYALQSGDYAQASQAWKEVLQQAELSLINRVKALLGYSFALIKLERPEQARAKLQTLLELSRQLKPQPADKHRLLPLRPERFQLLAWGLLARIADNPRQALGYRQHRAELLEALSGKEKTMGWKKQTRLSYLAKTYQQIAVEAERLDVPDTMRENMEKSFRAALSWRKLTEDDLGPVIYRSLINYLVLAISHPELFSTLDDRLLERQVTKTLQVFASQPYRSAPLVFRETKLSVLWAAYRKQVQDDSAADRQLKAVLKTKDVDALKKNEPVLWNTVQALVNTLSGDSANP